MSRGSPTSLMSGGDKDSRKSVALVDIILQRSRPEGNMDGLGPTMGGVEKSSTGAFGDIANPILSLTILVVSVDTTEGKTLVGAVDRRTKFLGIEHAVVGVVVGNANAVRMGHALERLLGLDGGFSGKITHKVDECEIGGMIHEDRGADVTSVDETSFAGGNETRGGAHELIHTNHLARKGGRTEVTAILGPLRTPRPAMSLTVGTARADGGFNRGKLAGDKGGTSHEF